MFERGMWKTKTFWGGIAAIATGIGLILNGEVPAGIVAIVTAIQTILVRDGIAKVRK